MKLALRLKRKEEPIIEELAAPKRVKRKIKRTGAYVGIDFLSNQIRISQLNKKGKEIRLEKVAFGKIPPEVYRAGRVANIDLLANTIVELCQQAGINGSFATVTLSGTNSVVRTVTLPKMTRSQLRQTIELQLGQFIPFPPEDTVYQYQVIGESMEEDMPMVEVLIVAGRYSVITPLLKAVAQAGFTPVAVKISYLSVLSVLKRYYEDFAQAVAIVDVRDRVTDVAFVAENTFEFSRTIEMGLEGLLGKIATQIGVSSADVQRKLMEGEIDLVGGKEEEAARLIEAVQSAFQGFANEIQRSIRYYEAKSKKRIRVGRVVLIGNVTGFFNLENFLSEILAVDVIVGDPLEQIDYAMADWFPPENKAQIAEIAVSIGASMEGIIPKLRREFNLLPREYQVVKRMRNTVLGTAAIIVLLAAWFYFQKVNLEKQIAAEQRTLAKIQEDISKVAADAEEFTKIQEEVRALAPKLRTFMLLFGTQFPWQLIMDELRTLIPQNIWLSQTLGGASEREGIDLSRLPEIQLKGQTIGFESMFRFAKRIYASEFFGDVDIEYRIQPVQAGGGGGGGEGAGRGGRGASGGMGFPGYGTQPEPKGVGSDLFQLFQFFRKRPELPILYNFTMKFQMDPKYIRPEALISEFQKIFGEEVVPSAPAQQPGQQPPRPPLEPGGPPGPGEGGGGGTPGY